MRLKKTNAAAPHSKAKSLMGLALGAVALSLAMAAAAPAEACQVPKGAHCGPGSTPGQGPIIFTGKPGKEPVLRQAKVGMVELATPSGVKRFRGDAKTAFAKARRAIKSDKSLSRRQRALALRTLGELEPDAAKGKVKGSFQCNGTVSTGPNGNTATGTCGFKISFG